MLGLQLPHAVGVEEMVERYTEELLTSVSKVPLTTGEIGYNSPFLKHPLDGN